MIVATPGFPLGIEILPERLAVCTLPARDEIPSWARTGSFFSHTRTADELSVICAQEAVPADVQASAGWRALKLVGPFELSQVGVLLAVAQPLAQAGISILPIGTFQTDYVLVAEARLASAVEVLAAAGHRFATALP